MKYKKNLQDIKRNLSQKRLSRELQRNIGIINKTSSKLTGEGRTTHNDSIS